MQFTSPLLLIRDIDLIKQITVKDFDHFIDRRAFANEEVDPIFAKNLLVLKGQKWRKMRSILSPTFTSSKMKQMFDFMSECGKNLTKFLLDKNEETVELQMKDLFSKFANDVIASTAFGYKCDSLNEPNNEFFKMGKDLTRANGWRGVKLLLVNFYPAIVKLFKLKIFPEASNFFYSLVSYTVKEREENNIIRPDMIHLMMEMKKGNLKYEESKENDAGFAAVQESEIGKSEKQEAVKLTDQDIAAQALLFFFAGFETVSTNLSFMAYELAINEDIQNKLIEEIDEIIQNCNGDVTYEIILKIKYLDMVISETLRKWSSPFVDRLCVKDFVIEPKVDGEKEIVVEKGVGILIPIYGFHMDPRYFPEPDRFDPERFSEENKKNIVPYSYMPFGIGPRNCIGSRFALLEMKVLIFHLLSKFKFVVIEKTQVPLKLTKEFRLGTDDGIWLGIKRR